MSTSRFQYRKVDATRLVSMILHPVHRISVITRYFRSENLSQCYDDFSTNFYRTNITTSIAGTDQTAIMPGDTAVCHTATGIRKR